MLEIVPGPTAYPFIGNALDVLDEVPIHALSKLADQYGPIYKLTFSGRQTVVISSTSLLEEVSDEQRFHKVISGALSRNQSGPPGLFTSPSEDDPDWGQAHRVLMPAFGPLPISDMFDEMHDIAAQLVMKWARKGSDYRIPVTSDFTRLTLDTIALCAMDYRFNSFYDESMHPFVEAMTRSLSARNGPSSVFGILQNLTGRKAKSIQEDRKYMAQVAKQLVQYRREHPSEKKDLLNAMLKGKDPKTGETMRDALIAANMITFLIAGHETTSGLLSFTFYYLLKSPAAYRTAQSEVDRVVGKSKIKPEHLRDLQYLNAVLRETLRLNPTAPAFVRKRREDSEEPFYSLGGYQIGKDWSIMCLIPKCQRDPEIYGEDADEFKPERMLKETFDKLPQSAWKPFGTGVRACIGRPLAWQEALLATALILQNFDLKMDDPSYELRIKQTLTIKPNDFYVKAELREGVDATRFQHALLADSTDKPPVKKSEKTGAKADDRPTEMREMVVAYGSNTGTCQNLAQRLLSDAEHYGFHAEATDLDSVTTVLKDKVLLVIITASYEGQPPDNATHFVHSIEATEHEENLKGLRYAVFGCGHSDWSATFQRIPTLLDDKLAKKGAQRIVERGLADVAKGDIFGDFDDWADHRFWPTLVKDRASSTPDAVGRGSQLEVEISQGDRASQLRQDVRQAIVLDNKNLVTKGEPEKWHMEIQLPSDATYEPGDYLAILPLNPMESVQRVMVHYHIPWDATITIKAGSATTLPIGTPISVSDLLKGYVELAQPATRKDIKLLVSCASDPNTRETLRTLSTDPTFSAEILTKRTSVLDLLSLHPTISLPFSTFLSLAPPMRLRHYSISSSPLRPPSPTDLKQISNQHCTITYAILSQPSLSGYGQFTGVASTYLSSLRPGDALQIALKPTSNVSFRLPKTADRIPMIMFCAGTGIAPFRGFVQHRAQQLSSNPEVKLAPALLFVGCRSGTKDRLYAEEIDKWVKQGAVDVRYAFSSEPEHGDAKGCRYVQERMKKDWTDVVSLWGKGAKVYVCGSPGLAKEVGETARELVRESLKEKEQAVEGGTDGEAKEIKVNVEEKVENWFKEQRKGERFSTDVFA